MGRQAKTRRAAMETKITSAVAKAWGTKHKLLPQINHSAQIQQPILSLKKDYGAKVSTREQIGSDLNLYFRSLLSEPNQDRTQAINKITSDIPPLVTEEQNSLLLREFTKHEIEDVIFTMASDKAPGPEGFTIEFFKAC